MTALKRKIATWRLRTRTLSLGERTLVMGVVNITPDSFSDGGLFFDPDAAVAHALRLIDEGADLLDLGAESTRPGSRAGEVADSAQAPDAHPKDKDPSLGTPVAHPKDKDPSLGTPVTHPNDKDPSLGTPVAHPNDKDPSLGTPVAHPNDKDPSLGTPVAHPNDKDPSLGTPVAHPNDKDPSLGTPAVSTEEEQARLLPVLAGILRVRPDTIISVDTYKAATARAALEAGAEIVNDVSGLTWDAGMAAVCAEFGAGVVLMHTRGRPEEWRAQAQLAPDALLELVSDGLAGSLATAAAAGIPRETIILDPGYGFGKRFNENYVLLARQAELLALGRPLLAGVSRKSFLWHTLAALGGDASVEARETASMAAMTAAILHGASIVRVHSVRPAVEAARIADAILAAA